MISTETSAHITLLFESDVVSVLPQGAQAPRRHARSTQPNSLRKSSSLMCVLPPLLTTRATLGEALGRPSSVGGKLKPSSQTSPWLPRNRVDAVSKDLPQHCEYSKPYGTCRSISRSRQEHDKAQSHAAAVIHTPSVSRKGFGKLQYYESLCIVSSARQAARQALEVRRCGDSLQRRFLDGPRDAEMLLVKTERNE